MKQLNPIKFYLDKRARTWDLNPESRCSDLVFYSATDISGFGNTPTFSFTVGSATTVTAAIYTENDIFIRDYDDPTPIDKITYKQVYFVAENHTFTDGYYYILLTVDGIDYYSDMFGVTSNLDDLIKIKVSSSDIVVGSSIQKISAFFTEFYLSAEFNEINPKIEQDGSNVDGIVLVDSGTAVYPHEFELDANENIYRYIYALGLLGCNGIVEITYGYETFTASDILVEKIESHGDKTYQIKLSFVDENETVQTLNSIA